jgi:hypothetical protein
MIRPQLQLSLWGHIRVRMRMGWKYVREWLELFPRN